MKYIAYCRKSTDEAERQVLSIQSQIDELKEFARREQLEVVDFVIESKTAKVPGRPKFAEVLRRIEKGEASGILAWHPDRLARNSIDGGRVIYLVDTGKLQNLKFPTFWFDNTPQGKFMLNIAFGQSKYYVDNLAENVSRGMRQKLRNGVWPCKAPLGYLNNPRTRGIDVDVETAKIVMKAFELFAQSNSTFTEVAQLLYGFGVKRGNGKPLHINEVRQILGNKFYLGIMKFAGEYYEGTHEQFISKDLFQNVQVELKKRDKHHAKSNSFPFLGVMKCSGCGASVTAEKHVKHYKRANRKVTYSYYRCTRKQGRCVEPPITTTDLEMQMRDMVVDVAIPASWAKQWLEWLERDEVEEKQNAEARKKELEVEVGGTDRKLNILLDGYLDQVINSETYKLKKNELFENKLKLQEEMGRLQRRESNWIEPMRNFVNTAVKGEKIARAENNLDEIADFVKNLGSNFFLHSRQISAVHHNGFDMLRAPAPVRNLLTCEHDHSLCVDLARIELATRRCERRGIPLTYRPLQCDPPSLKASEGHSAAHYHYANGP